MSGEPSNQAMQRTAGRSAFSLSMTSTFNLQRHSPSPAVADLGSRLMSTRLARAVICGVALLAVCVSGYCESPPQTLFEYFRWCEAAPNTTEKIKRFDGFRRRYLPEEDGGVAEAGRGYGDAAHIMHVRLAAYRLLALHLEARDLTSALQIATWLQHTDPVIGKSPSKK